MMDSNGSNTTAAAAVLAAKKHGELHGRQTLVLGGTGPVGHRAGAAFGSRRGTRSRGFTVVGAGQRGGRGHSQGGAGRRRERHSSGSTADLEAATQEVEVLIAAGAAGAELLTAAQREAMGGLRVAIDLNAVPPAGLGGIGVTDKAVERHGVLCYGAIGVGGTKMKIHKACLERLFEVERPGARHRANLRDRQVAGRCQVKPGSSMA